MKLRNLPALLLATSSAAFAGDAMTPAASVGDWEFSLSAGPAWRRSGSVGLTGGSRSADSFIPSFVGHNALITPPFGGEAEFAERSYDDGYVRTDGSTDIDGYTTHWGYQNAGQVDGDNLSFHATGFQSVRGDTFNRSSAPSVDRREQGIAPIIEFDGHYKHEIAGLRAGFSASLIWSPVKMNRQWNDFNLGQVRNDYRHDWTDVYNLGGFSDLVPPAPYSGTADTPGFVLENMPDVRALNSVLIGSENATLTNSVSTRFSADHTTLSFGPTLGKQLTPDLIVEAGMGISLHWLHWSASQNEKLTVSQNGSVKLFREWTDHASGNEVLGGLYLQLAAEWTPKDQTWSLKGLLRGDIGQTFSQRIGPSNVTYDLDGITAAVMISQAL